MPVYKDIHFLHHALRLAARGLGRTMPNPTVGCVIVQGEKIVGVGRTADGGRPHAETEALAMAGNAAQGATAYVSLEPCAHHGKTPPCAEALIAAGVARVVMACVDPDSRVSGKGAAMLRAAGIEVEEILLPEAAQLNAGFFRRVQQGMPYVSMKLATSSDYFMARGDGGGQWITGEMARTHGNGLRSIFDCVVTGIGTVLADDPLMTARAPNAPHPALIRVVADRQLRLPLKSKLVRSAERQPVWVITHAEAVELNASHATELRDAGVNFLVVEGHGGHDARKSIMSPSTLLKALAAEGITRVLIEAGPQLSTAFLAENLVDRLHWYRAPIALGNAGVAPINALEGHLAAAVRSESRALGDDQYERIELR